MWPLCLTVLAVAADTNSKNELFDWVRAMGGSVDPRLELSTGPDPSWTVRGVFATAPIAAGERIAYIPAEVQLCDKSMCGLIQTMRQEMVKKEKSKYYPYLKSMESHEVDYPNVWTDEERGLFVGMQPTDWTRHTAWFEWNCWPSIKNELQKESKDDSLSTPDPLTWRAMHLFVARVTTVQGQYCAIPIYDAMNHRNGPDHNMVWKHEGSPNVDISTTKPLAAGQQLWNTFGEGAGRMLRDYGFIEQNPTDWLIEADGTTCIWTLSEALGVLHVDWKEHSDQCLSILREHLASLPATPEVTVTMRPTRVAVALKYRENYMNSLRFAIHSLEREL